jgi:hypothetical protein
MLKIDPRSESCSDIMSRKDYRLLDPANRALLVSRYVRVD